VGTESRYDGGAEASRGARVAKELGIGALLLLKLLLILLLLLLLLLLLAV
jgi:hypothetical protein